MHINRRTFILGSLASLAAAGAGTIVPWWHFVPDKKFLNKVDKGLYSRSLGKSLTQHNKNYRDIRWVQNSLYSKLRGYNFFMGREYLNKRIRRHIQDDYLDGHIIIWDGWVLPETTTLLSAFAFLANSHVS